MTREEFSAILAAHYQTHAALAPRDVYKLIYQAVFGPEHSIDHLRTAMERLYLEVLHLPDTPVTVPLLEPLSPLLCRVNLQSFVQQGERADAVAVFPPDLARVPTRHPGRPRPPLEVFLATTWAQRYDAACLEQFWQRMATANFAPVHHSRQYAEANAPHYRVVLRALVERPGFP